MLFSFGAQRLKICSESPACNMPGVANTTIGPGLSMYALSKAWVKERIKKTKVKVTIVFYDFNVFSNIAVCI